MTIYKITVYLSKDGWRWRMKSSNGRVVASSGESFASQQNAIAAALRIESASISYAGIDKK